MIMLEQIEEATKILADESGQFYMRIRFGRHLYSQGMFMHEYPKKGMIVTVGQFRFQVAEVLNDLRCCIFYCHKLTRKRFNPEAEGFTKLDFR